MELICSVENHSVVKQKKTMRQIKANHFKMQLNLVKVKVLKCQKKYSAQKVEVNAVGCQLSSLAKLK